MESRISIIINHVINKGMIRSNRLVWFAPQRIVTLILLLVLCIDIQGQSPAQADLLRKAYSKHSKSLLYSFFDNWSDEISSNENESPNKWVAEAQLMDVFDILLQFYEPNSSLTGKVELLDKYVKLKEKGKLEKEIHKIFTEQQAHQNTDNK